MSEANVSRSRPSTARKPQARLVGQNDALDTKKRGFSRADRKGATDQLVKDLTRVAKDLASLQQKVAAATDVERHRWISSGVPTQYLLTALDWFTDTPEKNLLDAIGISYKTVERKGGTTLNPQHSDAALALIEITSMAEHALGGKAQAETWLSKPALALEGERPIDLLTSAPGIEAVKDLLTRIEYGVYA